MEENRIKSMKNHFESALSLQEPIPDNFKQINQNLSKSIQSINSERDIDSFVKKNKNTKTGPDYAIYEPYDASSSPTSPSNPERNSMPANALSSSATVTSPNLSTSTFKDRSPTIKDSSGLNHSKENVFGKDLKSKETSSSSYSSAASSSANYPNTKNLVKAIYDYNATDENELTLKANDTVTVLQKDDSGWWQGSLPNGKIGMFPSNFVKPIEAETAEPYRGKVCRCLYDYEATDEDELSMKEGEKMTIDSEDNGWYFVHNQSGKYGRVPSNYVDLMNH